MIHDHPNELDAELLVCNCAGCRRELLSPKTVDGLAGVPLRDWPPLARTLRRRGMTVHSRCRMGDEFRPFCAACVAAGRHETVRADFEARWYRRRAS